MDHLACFMAGNLALGAMTSNDAVRAARDLRTGKVKMSVCVPRWYEYEQHLNKVVFL